MNPLDESPLPRELPDSLDPSEGITDAERVVNLVVAAVLVAFGLYACFKPF
jgi:hypothetical protein